MFMLLSESTQPLSNYTFEACFEINRHTVFSLRPSTMGQDELDFRCEETQGSPLYLAELFQDPQIFLPLTQRLSPKYCVETIINQGDVREHVIIKRADTPHQMRFFEEYSSEDAIENQHAESTIDHRLSSDEIMEVYEILRRNGAILEFDSPESQHSTEVFMQSVYQ